MKRIKMLSLFFQLFLSYLTFFVYNGQLQATGSCPQDHCSKISVKMNAFCIENGFAGRPFMVLGPTGEECFCPCSCVSSNTRISVPELFSGIPIQKLHVGQDITSPYSIKDQNLIDHLLSSEFKTIAGKVHRLTFSNGSSLTVSPEHPFVGPDMKVLSAEELTPGKSVLDENEKEVYVKDNTVIRDYRGTLMNIIINRWSQKARNHFLITNSILSGDWLIQANYISFKNEIDARLGLIKIYSK